MFSKSKINETNIKPGTAKVASQTPPPPAPHKPSKISEPVATAKTKPPASILSSDLIIKGNMQSSGDIQIEGQVEGDVHAHLLTVGDGAVVRGEIVADDIVVNGRVIGCVRGLKVRLTSSARVEGDIIHKTIAIESGAHFEGSVQREDDPLNSGKQASRPNITGQSSSATPPMPFTKPAAAEEETSEAS